MKTTIKIAIWSLVALLATGFTTYKKDDIKPSNARITLTTAKKVKEKIILRIDADKDDVWIDLNNNGIQDSGEAGIAFGSSKKYTLGAKTVTIYGKVTGLNCNNNQLTALDVSKNTLLKSLYCSDNQLKALDVSKNTALEEMECNGNQITGLNVSKNTALWLLGCGGNPIKTLNVSKNTALKVLGCSDNLLTELNVSKNTKLQYLHCFNNQIKVLDVSKNTELEYLHCYNNQLKALNVSKNTALMKLECNGNLLTALNVSKNTKLQYLYCFNNAIFGSKMNALVNSLPKRMISSKGNFYVIDLTITDGNKCTPAQVNIAKNKNWKVLNSQGQPYTGN